VGADLAASLFLGRSLRFAGEGPACCEMTALMGLALRGGYDLAASLFLGRSLRCAGEGPACCEMTALMGLVLCGYLKTFGFNF